MDTQPRRILIVGGGFGGIQTALKLSKKNIPNTEIMLVSNKSYLEYYPALYRVVTGASPIEVCVPLSDILPEKKIIIEKDMINGVDLKNKVATGASGSRYRYDTIVLALGSQTIYFDLPGLAQFSRGFKSLDEALALKHHIHDLFKDHAHPDKNELVSHFHVVVVGGGPSGVEVAGDLFIYMQKLSAIYSVDPSLITIDLIEANSRLLPMVAPDVSAKVLARLRKIGINIFLNRQLMRNDIAEVYMKDMSLQSRTVIWTAGTQISTLYRAISGLTLSPKRRIEVDEYLHAKGYSDVYIIGDGASTPYAGLAQTAIYDGNYVANHIANTMHGRKTKSYVPQKTAFSVPVGNDWGVFIWGPIKIYGFVAYLIRHAIDMLYFAEILNPKKFVSLFFEGFKYRKVRE